MRKRQTQDRVYTWRHEALMTNCFTTKNWQVKDGKQDEFIKCWTALLNLTRETQDGLESAQRVVDVAVVASGAVVSRSVAPFTVGGGVPASVIGQRSGHLEYTLGHRKRFQ